MTRAILSGRWNLLTQTRVKVDTSLDGDGWSIRVGESHWRFARYAFAEQFSIRMLDEHFASEIMEHAHNHVWSICKPESCKGALWQIIQGLN